MDRALREFRIRGVKTNLVFLESLINNKDFQDGKYLVEEIFNETLNNESSLNKLEEFFK